MKIERLDSLRPGSGKMERGRREGQNFQLGSSAPGRRSRVSNSFFFSITLEISRIFRNPNV